MLRERDRLDEAEPLLAETLAIRERLLGAEHAQTVVSLYQLSALRLASGDEEGAEVLARQAAEAYAKGGPSTRRLLEEVEAWLSPRG